MKTLKFIQQGYIKCQIKKQFQMLQSDLQLKTHSKKAETSRRGFSKLV